MLCMSLIELVIRQVLRKYPDKTAAQDLVKELDSYEARPGGEIKDNTTSFVQPF